ncbi:MAG: T9SS type A sorting domain-containing protein [Bacteroidia bacterium]|nr:T9SS type A sorting domain-containing protein [Bacteroidia bacterium]MDW8088994.1 T9SS type A sorting domain-containing protein [Bacteroidia bacterium]
MWVLAFFLGLGWAQLQLTQADLPNAGEQHIVSQARATLQVDYLATGAGYSWNFAQLSPDTQLRVEWKRPTEVPRYIFNCGNLSFQALLLKLADSLGSFSIPGSGTIQARDLYAFLRKSSSEFAVNGIGVTLNGLPITSCYRDPDEVYVLPMQYGRRDSTTFWVRFDFAAPGGSQITLSQRGYRIHQVDGYGTVTTPLGTFSCLRLRQDVRQWDTLFFNGLPMQRRDTSYTLLEWLGREQGVPLVRVQGTFQMNRFFPTLVQYKDTLRSTRSPTATAAPFTFPTLQPNPTRGVLYIPLPGARYILRNVIGQVIGEGEIPPEGKILLSSTLPSGVYYLQLFYEGRENWQRFVFLNSE